MSQETTHIPKLRFPEFEDDWATERLGDFYTFKNGVNAEKEAYGSGIKFVNVMDIVSDSPLRYDKIIGEVEISESEFKKNEVIYGDILFQRSSETREEVGQSNVYIDKTQKATFGGFVIRGRATQKQKHLFMHYLLKTQKVRKDMTARSGGSTRYNVGQESLSKVIIKTTNDECEQQKIASFLTVTDKKIELLQRKKDQLTAYKKGMMQKLFSQEIRFKDEDGKDFPEWEEKKLGDVAKFKKGKRISKNDISENGSTQCIRYGELYTDYREVIATVISSTNVNPDDLILSKGNEVIIPASGETALDIATASCVMNKGVALGGDLNIINTQENGVFLAYYLNSAQKICIARLAQGISVIHLYSSQLATLKIKLPDKAEQQKIANYLTALDQKIELVNRKLIQAQSFKKGLLQQMFI